MAENIEIKARVRNWPDLQARARALSGSEGELLEQEDTFFRVPAGRLKLRILSPQHGELIYYERPDHDGPRQSSYLIAHTPDPQALKTVLAAALGIRGVVRKSRHLHLVSQTRIHLDEVAGLGYFMELEYVLRPGENGEQGLQTVHSLMDQLGILQEDLVAQAYMDLLEKT
jgi:predicted adenylyl cyclase CyaB